MRKKILVITPFYYPNIGGAETFAEDLIIELKKVYDVSLCTLVWNKQKLFKGTGLIQFLQVFPKLFILAYKQIRKERPDRVISLGLISGIIGSILNVKQLDIVLLALYNFNGKGRVFCAISRFIFKRCRKIYVEGETGKKDVMFLGCYNKKIIKFQHWCNQDIFHPIKKVNKRLKVLFVGRPIPEKGIRIIRKVEQMLSNEEIDFEFIQNVAYKDLAKHYQMADVVVVPSLYDEGFSRVVIESASSGCVLVVSNKGALPEMVRPFGIVINGYLGYSSGFRCAILNLYKNKNLLKCYMDKSVKYSKDNFSNKNAEVFI